MNDERRMTNDEGAASMTVEKYRMRGTETEAVLMIEYVRVRGGKWRPWSVFTTGGVHDFDYCRRDDQLYWHESGNSSPYLNKCASTAKPLSAVWIAPGVDVHDACNAKRILKPAAIRRMGFLILEEPANGNPFDHAQGDTQTIWCDRCRDHLPDESDNPCEHIWYCENCNRISAPGERCKHRRDGSLLPVPRTTPQV